MRNWKTAFCAILCMAWLLGTVALPAQGEGGPSMIGYSVEPVLPDNQVSGSKANFNLMVTEGDSQSLYVTISNKADEEIQVAAQVGTAVTNENGVIIYVPNADASHAVSMSDILTPGEQVITVPARGSALAEFFLTVPEAPFEGSVFGGITFTKLNQDQTSGEGGAMQIRNVYRYVISVRLRHAVSDISPEFKLLGAKADFARRSPGVALRLSNPRPVIVRGAAMRVSIQPKDGGEAVLTADKTFDIAPNSGMNYFVHVKDTKALPAGEYVASVIIEHKELMWALETPLIIE